MHLKRIFTFLLKSLYAILLIVLMIVVATSGSYIYDFAEPTPFSGPDIFNPYSNIDTAHCWKRANIHTHTRVEGILNECEFSADSVYHIYKSFDYDIIGFTNHNELTKHPIDKELQMDIYEHGYNTLNYHIMTYGAKRVWLYDALMPLFASQKQFMLDKLSDDADIVQINHPQRIRLFNYADLEKISGYRLMELTAAEEEIENKQWDIALSAGRYSHGIMNDDLHYPDRPEKIAIRCSFICTPTERYEHVKEALIEGCFYSMSVPNYGDGDWSVKYALNRELPKVKDIGLRDSTIYIELSTAADSIKFVGSNHRTLHTAYSATSAEYTMQSSDPYARIMVFYNDGAVIYSNAFARYDKATMATPSDREFCKVNTLATILYNIAVVAVIGILAVIYLRIVRRWRTK